MTIDFKKYAQGNCLNLEDKHMILSEILSNEENLNAFNSFIKTNSNIIALNLAKCNIDSKRIKLLVEVLNESNITDLDVPKNKLDNAGAIAEVAKLSKLTALDISGNLINDKGIAEIAKFLNLNTLNIHNGVSISPYGIEMLATLKN